MLRINFRREHFWLLFAAVFTAAAVAPIAFIGIPDTVDLPQHFRFATQFYHAILEGDLFPGWAGQENFGYGDVGIRFYPPLAYYVLAFSRMIAGNWYDAAFLTFVFWMVLGCFGIYFWSRSWFSIKESSIIAIVYALIPFHLNQLYTGFNQFSELAATSLLTFCFAFLTRLLRQGKLSDILGLGFFFGLLILTHLPTTIVGSISLLIYFFCSFDRRTFVRSFAGSASAAALGLMISAFYWLRMITEIKWLNHESERYSQGFFDYAGNFFPLALHITGKPIYIYFIQDLIVSFTVICFSAALIPVLFRKRFASEGLRSAFASVFPVGIFSFLMFTPLSKPIWQVISPIQKIQFPIRWVPVTAMCAAIVFGAAIGFLIKNDLLNRKTIFYSTVPLTLVILLFNFTYILHPSSYIPLERSKFESKISQLPDEESFFCWWTIWSKQSALKTSDKVSANGRNIVSLNQTRESLRFAVDSGKTTTARLAMFYYPHWKASVNGVEVETKAAADGAIIVDLPADSAEVSVEFIEPPHLIAARWISISSVVGVLLVFLVLTWKDRKRQFP
ncbi:MAG: glycosyltransferase family 39 protein [Pyrinomonadaceae bacterium]|nr:glycosyltransferase family 39 protein [Pyrinomonadaceae bacterium]